MLTQQTRSRSALVLSAAAASWGIATVISKRAVTEIDPFFLLAVQLASSSLVLVAVLTFQGQLSASPAWRRDALLGILNPGLSYLLGLAGLTYISASLSVLLWATEPLLIFGLAWLYLKERSRRVAGSIALAAVGVALVGIVPNSRATTTGVLLTLAGVAACAVYTIVARKLGLSGSTVVVVATQQVSALVFAVALLGGWVISGQAEIPSDVSALAWTAAVGSGVLYYAVAFLFYLTGLRDTPASVAGAYLNLIPLFGIAAGFILLDERLSARQWIGAFLIFTAVIFVAQTRTNESK